MSENEWKEVGALDVAERGPVEAAEPAPERRTVEDWAERAKLLPQFIQRSGQFLSANELTQTVPNPDFWKYAAARALRNASEDPAKRWQIGRELTQAEFDAAIEEGTGQAHG